MTKMTQLWMSTALALTAAGCAAGSNGNVGVVQSELTITPLADGIMQSVNDKIDLKKGPFWVHTDSLTLQPGEVIPFHSHPAQGALVVTQGTITFQHTDGSYQVVSAGQVAYEDPREEHSPINCGTEPVTVIGTFFIPGCDTVGCKEFINFDFSRPPATCP